MNSNNYPVLNLQDALGGAPIVIDWEGGKNSIGYIHASHSESDTYFFECEAIGMIPRPIKGWELERKAKMWVKPIVFHRWHLLHERVVAIRKSSYHKWKALDAMGKAFASYNELTLKDGFFPACEVGTVIKRPQ